MVDVASVITAKGLFGMANRADRQFLQGVVR